MPPGVPVGTLAIGRAGAVNAALLAAGVLALSDPRSRDRLEAWRKRQTEAVAERAVERGRRVSAAAFASGPDATIGILGGGQLGRMLALAAARLGFKCHVLCPERDSPAFDVVRRVTEADYADKAALDRFADDVDVITYEFENVPAETATFLAARKPVLPDPQGARRHPGPAGREGFHRLRSASPPRPMPGSRLRASSCAALGAVGAPGGAQDAALRL